MFTDRVLGFIRLCRLVKYMVGAAIYAAWSTITVNDALTAAPAIFLFLVWMAFGPVWNSSGQMDFRRPWKTAVRCAAQETLIAVLILFLVRRIVPTASAFPEVLPGLSAVLLISLAMLNRWLPSLLSRVVSRRLNRRRVLILGSPGAVECLREQLQSVRGFGIETADSNCSPPMQYSLRLFQPESEPVGVTSFESEILRHIDGTHDERIHHVAYVRDFRDKASLASQQEIERLCDIRGLRMSVCFLDETAEHRPAVPVVIQTAGEEHILREPLDNPVNQAVKRMLDILISIPVVVLVLPLLCVAVRLAQRFQSEGPLLFRQERRGKNGSVFEILKFRTMHVPPPGTAETDDDVVQRTYSLGALLRRTRLDEIPQFINVLQGTMSIVGPRAHHLLDGERFRRAVRHYPLRALVKPGITGLAQYREFRGRFHRNCVESRVRSDMEYINGWSLWLDLSLIVKSCRVIVEPLLSAAARRPAPQFVFEPAARSNVAVVSGNEASAKRAA